ncbi:molybdopterin-dependent oxidoreductase [Desulfovibrio sp. UCD-KL4C]|uniref:molybdopterin-containing oxidoreductase family protein n=1 Tax=Desulfovibrio sp. UCD-KL4C TaxID=2578120 RepID=UPI0025C08948|nr:molybdopterin-dependent oxidoreductase [Desulfovibrio sp. UCD-KL4C]
MNLQQALDIARVKGEEVTPTVCGMCGPGGPGGGCGIYAFTKNGRFVRVAGMDESPNNRGALCAKAHAAPQWVYSKDRLTTPLRRIGKKGEGKFEKISWDEAITHVADKLLQQKEQYGPESLAVLSPAKRSYSEYLQRFTTVHGSPNYGHSGICALQRAFSFMYTVADWPAPDYNQSDLIIFWGRQPIYSGPVGPVARALLAAKQRNAQIIAIKPSVEPDVGMSDIWVPIRPGTDAALALAMLHVVIKEDLVDHDFVDKWCYGFEALKTHIQQYSPSWAENITGIPASQIEHVAKTYATCPKAAIDVGNGLEHAPSASDAIRSIAMLIAITGHLDRPGGNMLKLPPQKGPKNITLRERHTQDLINKLVGPEFPKPFQPFIEGPTSAYYRIWESVLTKKPYPIRGIIAPGTQPLASTRGTKNVLAALEKLDFLVVVDVARTPEIPWADIVIPVATGYEINHPFQMGPNWLMANNKVIEPVGSKKSIFEFFLDLGKTMGYGEDFWQGDIQTCMDDQLAPLEINMDTLRSHQTGIVFPTAQPKYEKYDKVFKRQSPRIGKGPFLPQGKVALYNTLFEEAGYSPLPEWREPPESITGTPELNAAYPLILSDYHTSKNFSAAWQRNVPHLREIQPDPAIHIHPNTAAKRNINDGDWVTITSPHGWIKVKAELYPGIRPDTVMLLHGWWQGCQELGLKDYPLADGGANVNTMYSVAPEKAYDPLVTAMASQTLVEVQKYVED